MQSEVFPTAMTDPAQDTAVVRIDRGGVLDIWLAHTWDNGVQIDQLDDLQAVRVETRNNSYDLAIVSGRDGEVLVRGGRYFPEWTPVQYLGCSLGRGLLKCRGVHVGLHMEFYSEGRLVITSAVQAIARGTGARSDNR